jgi:hypothetical protein
MKKGIITCIGAISILLLVSYISRPASVPAGFIKGTPEIKSISTLAFGPNGILFIGDSKSAGIFAVDTKDIEPVNAAKEVEVKNIDDKIAAFLGTEAKNISIRDLKVNPISKKIYCAVQSSDGSPVLLIINGDQIQPVSLKDVMYSSIMLNNAPAEKDTNKWGMRLRLASISDMNYNDGKLLVSGLSNQEFGSSFRSIPFPFKNEQYQSSLRIYHAAHGQYETEAPIETFTTADLNGKNYLIASYTCSPLVLFPLTDLKPGVKVEGRTVGEMGAGNRPLDMITMKKGNDLFLIIANSDRPVMKVKYKDIESYQGSLTTQVKEAFATAGVPYISFPFVGVTQLDKLDDTQFVFLQRKSNGELDLRTVSNDVL